uniref:Uncharacterized protein n=1 Tax=Arundo donax TaxID=35708 RepID=A0A0A9DQF2_ARUDO
MNMKYFHWPYAFRAMSPDRSDTSMPSKLSASKYTLKFVHSCVSRTR